MSDKAKEFSNEIHHQRKKKFPRRKVVVYYTNETWAVDLASMETLSKDNDGYKFILCVIDVFSKFAWTKPLKNKSATTVLTAMKEIISEIKDKPKYIWSDKGTEFYNKDFQDWCKENKIKLYSTYGESKSVVAERFIKTLKQNIAKYFTETNKRNWIDILPELTKKYNESKHSTIDMTPIEASKPENEMIVFQNLMKKSTKIKETKPKFKVGDQVRISKIKQTFSKGYSPNWSYEVFTVSEVLKTNPITYKLEDYDGDPIEGSFYENEMLKTNVPDYFEVEKILKTRTVKGKKEYFVHFYGWDKKFDQWIPESQITEI